MSRLLSCNYIKEYRIWMCSGTNRLNVAPRWSNWAAKSDKQVVVAAACEGAIAELFCELAVLGFSTHVDISTIFVQVCWWIIFFQVRCLVWRWYKWSQTVLNNYTNNSSWLLWLSTFWSSAFIVFVMRTPILAPQSVKIPGFNLCFFLEVHILFCFS